MAAAEKNPDRDPANKRKDLVTRFREDYEVVLAEARVSAEHTATDGWKKLYLTHRREEQAARRDLGARLKSLGERMEQYGLNDEEEKEIGDAKKQSTALREAAALFELQTVRPVQQPSIDCAKVIEEYRRAAQLDEANHPLVEVGLEELMKAEIAKVSRAEWDEDTGCLTISP